MEGFALYAWVEFLRGSAAGLIAYASASGVQCPACHCSCDPRLTCPGGHSSEATSHGLGPLGAALLVLVSAAGCATALWLGLRAQSVSIEQRSVGPPLAEYRDAALSIEDFGARQAREIRARRLSQ